MGKKIISFLSDGILSGIFLCVGCCVSMSVESKPLGAFLFSLGLCAIIVFKFGLFTGKAGYMAVKPLSYVPEVVLTFIGNATGAAIGGFLLNLTRLEATLSEKAAAITATKFADSPLSIFVLAVFCGILMFTAVHGQYQRVFAKYPVVLKELHKLVITGKALWAVAALIIIAAYFSTTGQMTFTDAQKEYDKMYLEHGGKEYGYIEDYVQERLEAYRQAHESDFIIAEAAARYFKAHGITKLPARKALQAEIEQLISEKDGLYNTYHEQKQRFKELQTVKRNIDQILRRDEPHRRKEQSHER